MVFPSAPNGVRDRLPTLDEVLLRKTRPPVDLFCFYIFLQREGNEDSLDFWLDVHQHENLCRAYFKDIRKSGRSLREEWPQYWNQALSSGSSYDQAAGITAKDRASYHSDPENHQHSFPSSSEKQQQQQQQQQPSSTSEYYDEKKRERRDTEAGVRGLDAPLRRLDGGRASPVEGVFPSGVQSQQQGGAGAGAGGAGDRRSGGAWAGLGGIGGKRRSGGAAPMVIPRSSAITRGELLLSAERIYARYLLQGGEKEIYLPPSLRINSFPLPAQLSHTDSTSLQTDAQSLASVPDMFLNQKAYVHTCLVQDAFPRFLRAKAFGNLTPATAFVRMLLGLLVLWGGLVAALCFVFLDIKPRSLRLTLLVPFYLSSHLLLSSLYALDPLLVLLFNKSETTPLRHLPLQEVYVRKLLRKRSLGLELAILVLMAVGLLIWYWIPGHRL
ncbi:RGS domain-containing protein [Mrakia frigida]|uniref:Rax1p n=1 Tax=Mrakia frigida TaxID=29902 RepID=UPI003FCBF962